jgi:hypothetical protein
MAELIFIGLDECLPGLEIGKSAVGSRFIGL